MARSLLLAAMASRRLISSWLITTGTFCGAFK